MSEELNLILKELEESEKYLSYGSKNNEEVRKSTGSFYTPIDVATFFWHQFFYSIANDKKKLKYLLKNYIFIEPSFGSGILFFSFVNYLENIGISKKSISKIKFYLVDINKLSVDYGCKKVKDLEIEIRNPSVLRMNISLFYDNNNLFFDEESCMLFIRDLTEFYKFQQLKSDFVANVSHELRTPLQSIKMGLETFDKNSDINKNSEVNNLLPVMISQSERMENLIRDLLSLSKIELQEHIRPTHEINLIEVIDYVIKTYENIVKKNNVNIEFQKTENFKIIGDRDKLIEIFTNLIDNSIKYSDKNKEIKITTKKEGNLNIVSVEDQGIGIPKEFIHRITERFYTVDPSKSRSVGGTGLGLAIVKHLVSQHRGEMDISSVQNKGTTISVKFNSL